jgi:hypothetical protein
MKHIFDCASDAQTPSVEVDMDRYGLLQTRGVRAGLADYQKFLQITDDFVRHTRNTLHKGELFWCESAQSAAAKWQNSDLPCNEKEISHGRVLWQTC